MSVDLGDAGGSGMALRRKREDYDVVKHDSCFSEWKVLVTGKEQRGSGGERLRSRNLPSPHVGAGVYELGVTLPAWKTGGSGALKSEDIVVVYVGYADHIRKRLLRYCQAGEAPRSPTAFNSSISSLSSPGRSGSNSVEEPIMSRQKYSIDVSRSGSVNRFGRRSSRLEKQLSIERRGPLSPIPEPESDGRSGSPRGPRLFSEVFVLGCSIAFRWASTKSKDDAEFVVSELTDAFDYAWNRGGNSDARSQDVLQKIVLGKRVGASDSDCCTRNNSRWQRFLFQRKPVGVKVPAARKPPREPRSSTHYRRPRCSSAEMQSCSRGMCVILLWCRPHLTLAGGSKSSSGKHSEFTKMDIPVDRCGVLLDNGLVCNALPQKGRKRCHVHFDARKPPPRGRKTSQVASSQDSRGGSLASIDSLTRLELQGAPPQPAAPSAGCFPFLAAKKPAPAEQQRRRGSVSFSTWLRRSELLKQKSLEWLLAMEEIKGRDNSNNNDDNIDSTSPIMLSTESLEAEYETPVKAGRISLNLNQSMPVDDGMPPTIVARRSTGVRWSPAPLREAYATSFNPPPPFPRISFS